MGRPHEKAEHRNNRASRSSLARPTLRGFWHQFRHLFQKNPQHLRYRHTGIVALTLLWTIGVTGCMSVGDGITDLKLQVVVSDGVNPDRSGRPSPVFLQMFELRETASFRNSSYLDVYRDPKAALGGAFIAKIDIGPLYPGTEFEETYALSPTAMAVGVIGEFNRYQDMSSTMQVLEVTPGKDKKVQLRVDAKGLWLR
ncbi:MAG: type VI secretion system lipoprotein TssJ [Pseudomonadota bacterium]